MAVYHGDTRTDWPMLFAELKQYHDEAYRVIDTAIKLEEERKNREAVERYEQGLILIDRALSIQLDCPQNPDFSWEKACMMMQKMRKTRKEVLHRISDAQVSAAGSASSQQAPPSYEEAMSAPSSPVPEPSQIQTYEDLGKALQRLKPDSSKLCDEMHGELLFTVDGVRIYFISPDGSVTSPSDPGSLQIVHVKDAEGEVPSYYLQLGTWIYPLVPGVSPCFRTQYGALILPDLHSDVTGAAVGLILPENADASLLELLDDILQGVMRQEAPQALPRMARAAPALPPAPYSYSQRISGALISGAKYVSNGLVWGASKAANLITQRGTPALVSHIQPVAQPRPVSPGMTRGVQFAKDVSGKAVQFTGFVASKVGTATVALGRYLAPHVREQGTKLLTKVSGSGEEEAKARMEGVLEVAAGAVQGIGTVYEGLERSASILGSSLANSTVTIVKHRYGNSAGQVTGEALDAVGNVWLAGRDIRHLSPKGLAKTTAIGASKGVVEATGHLTGPPSKEE
ncbi:protein spartin [Schistocerca gregaria]|uniref:protein spartin n=1 Tax=Schistocerca gregaria TaxID=7010 RepID=UPI00211E974A|nr:protein spartin [Schistocerca gregaria]